MDGIHVDGSYADDNVKSIAMKKQHACSVTVIDTIHELGMALHDTLLLKYDKLDLGSNLHSYDGGSSSQEDENTGSGDCNSDTEGSIVTSSKCLNKSATFPIAVKEDMVLESQLENKSCTRSQSLLAVKKLISAMKGGREKEGVPPRKLSVSWAHDVYDPPPTTLSHYPRRKSRVQVKSNKKHGKGKQKGKNVRGGGSGSKDKKPYHKKGRKSERCLDSLSVPDRALSSNMFTAIDMLDLDDDIDIGSPDSCCGSNFLEQASGNMNCVC